ncbi:MAG: TIGR00282 family metallophosphoesterase [Spirochaetales bacterium]|nr:TIGR00282 family metallophosphoesterase [Spirochaetales bacterium]
MPANDNHDVIRVLAVGDIVGKPGCRALFSLLKSVRKETRADLVIVNGENASDGSGLTPDLVNDIYKAGADVITSGNHIWRKREIYPVLEKDDRMLRPDNYPVGVPGKGSCTVPVKDTKVSILNLEGVLNRSRLRCPFLHAKEKLQKLKKESPIVIIDFHAEFAAEKEALAVYLDGEISVLFGTHTHVQTADERIFPKGTGYITDIGMTGPIGSVIGMNRDVAMRRACTQLPLKLEVAENKGMLMGVVFSIDMNNGRTVNIERVQEYASV